MAGRQRRGGVDGGGGAIARGLRRGRSASFGVHGGERCAGAALDGACRRRHGKSRAEAATAGLMDRQTLRDWVVRFNANGPAGLIDKPSPGRPPKLTPLQKQELRQLVEEGPGRHDPDSCPLAARRPGGGGQRAVCPRLPRDDDRPDVAGAWLLPRQPAAAASRAGRTAAEEFKKTSSSG